MGEAVFFRNLTTKGLTAVNSGERYFEGYLTVQVKDKQGEVTIVDELMKVLPVWIDRGAPISDTHSNRIIGKGINYSKVEYKDKDGEIYPAIQITGKIHKNYELDNDIWQKIKSGEYKGLSFGGATKSDREPMRMKDGSIAYSLKDLEHYEVAVCRDPAVPLALITEFNTLAKAAVDGEDLGGGRMLIKCDKYGCYVDKANNSEGGLKAPEARNEALVYDDKTLDQPSETPIENPAKVKKGEDWSNADGDRHGMYNQDTDEGGMGKKHTGPKGCKCGDPKCKDPKCRKREVGTGHGAEENNTADGWSGSGSPYPKNASEGKDEPEYSDDEETAAETEKEFHETWHKINPDFSKKKKKKKKAIMTNIHTRLKNFDFMLKRFKKPYKQEPEKAERWRKFFEEYKDKPEKAPLPYPKSNKIPKRAVGGSKQELPDKSPKDKKIREGMVSTFGKASVITNIHSRLKSLDFMLKRKPHDDITGTRQNRADDKPGEFPSDQPSKTRGDKWMKYYYWNSGDQEGPAPTSPATLANYLKPSDDKYPTPRELADERRKKDVIFPDPTPKELAEAREKKEAKAKKLKKSFFMRVKDGEFGGMNTGETEWTEPRDTANSRTERDNDVT